MFKSEVGSIIIDGDERCLNRCTFCEGFSRHTDVNKKYSDFLNHAQFFIDNDYERIEISGNDPLQYSKIVDVVKHLKENGIKEITLSTHGRNLKDKALAIELAEAGLDLCRIPLYGSNEIIHNKATQYVVPGKKPLSVGNSFSDTIAGIKNCVDQGIKICGHIVPMQYNKHDLSNIIDLYLNLTSGHMRNMIIASACVTEVNLEYTSDWYLPIKDAGPYIKNILNHDIKRKYPYIYFKIMDFPYCIVDFLDRDMSNLAVVPNLGSVDVQNEKNRSKEDSSVPHYRLKEKFKDCANCLANKICGGVYKNDRKLFGIGKLKAINTDAILNYQQDSLNV